MKKTKDVNQFEVAHQISNFKTPEKQEKLLSKEYGKRTQTSSKDHKILQFILAT